MPDRAHGQRRRGAPAGDVAGRHQDEPAAYGEGLAHPDERLALRSLPPALVPIR